MVSFQPPNFANIFSIMQTVCDDLMDLIEEASSPDHFEMLFSLIHSEYHESGGDQPSDDDSYNSNLALLISWQVKDYLNTVEWNKPASEQAEAYDRCVRAFRRCVEATL